MIDALQASGGRLQADLCTLCSQGLQGICVVTSVVLEGPQGSVQAIEPLAPKLVAGQVASALARYPIVAVKVGMTVAEPLMRGIGKQLRRLPPTVPIVVDPSLRTYRHRWLIKPGHDVGFRRELLTVASVITPNLTEACLLADFDVIEELGDMEEAARRIASAHPRAAVLITGGHLHGEAVDVLHHDGELIHINGPWFGRDNVDGAGSVLTTMLAARLARGQELRSAVWEAKHYLTRVLDNAPRRADKTPQISFGVRF